MDKIRLGLVGVGNHGPFYEKFAHRSHRAQIVAMVDPESTRLEHAAPAMNIAANHCFSSANEQFYSLVDAVIVATPATVRQPVWEALKKNKHVFCENPLALNLHEADKIVKACARHPGMVCTVNEQWRWLPGVKTLRELVISGRIGKLLRVVTGGKGRHALEQEISRIGSHLLSVIIHEITGPATSCVTSFWRNGADVVAMFDTKKGLPVIAEFWMNQYDVGRCFIRLEGTEGRLLAIGGFLENVYVNNKPYPTVAAPSPEPDNGWGRINVPGTWTIQAGMEPQALQDPVMNPTFWLFDEFGRAILDGKDNPSPPVAALPVIGAMDALVKSCRMGGQREPVWTLLQLPL